MSNLVFHGRFQIDEITTVKEYEKVSAEYDKLYFGDLEEREEDQKNKKRHKTG